MRQTNNALNLLNASYQAVFKHSYVTGLASTVALLSISPYASAASFANNTADGAKTDYIQGAQETADITRGPWYADQISITGGDKNNTGLNIKAVSGDSKVYFNTGAKITNAFLNVSGSDTYEARLTGSFNTANTPISGEIEFNGSKLNISQGKVEVNTASFDTSNLVIQGKAGKNGVNPTDTLLNYSALRTGQAAKSLDGQAGKTSFYNTDVSLGDYSALDAMGDVTFERGTIKITAAKNTNGTDYAHGELAAKAVIRAQELTLGSDQYGGNLHVGQNADGKAAGGAIYAAHTTLNNATVTVDKGSSLQIAGQMSQVGVDGTTNLAEGSANKQNINTNLESGELTLNGNVVNNGEILLGGNSIVSSDNGTVSQYNASQYDIEQTGGTFTNNGTLRLGDALVAEGVTFDQSEGTSYTLSNGNFKNSGSVQITKNSQLQQTGGVLDNEGTIQADNGAVIDIQDGTFKNGSLGTIALKSGSSFNIDADAIYKNKKDYSVTQGENIAVADVNDLGKIDAESGSKIKLQNGMFKAELTTPNSLGANIANAIARGTKVGSGTWTISNATLQLANDLDLTSNKLASTNIKGDKGAVLATTGDLTFTSTSGVTGSMGGFDKLQGGDVTINRVSGDSYKNVWLKATAKKTIAATKSVTTNDGSPLAIGNNMTLELTTEQFHDGVTDITTADARQPDTHQVKVDLTVGSGGALNVAADHWTAQNITTEQGSQLNITGTAQNSTNQDFRTHAQLSAQNFNFDGAVNAEDGAVLTSAGDTNLNSHAYVQLTDSTLNTQNLNINGEGIGADAKQGYLNLENSTLSATQAINVDNGKLSAVGSKLYAQNFTLSNGAVISFTNSQVTVHDKLSTDDDATSVNKINLDDTDVVTSDIALNANSTLTANNSSSVVTNTMRYAGGKGSTVQADFKDSSLTIKGDKNSNNGISDLNVKLSMNGGSLNLGDALDTVGLSYEGGGFKTNNDFQQITANSTRVSMDLSNSNLASIDKELKQQLFEKMFDTNDSADAYLSLSGVTSSDITTSKDENGNIIVDFGDLTDENGDVNMDYDTDTTKEAILTNVDATKKISGGWKAIQSANDQLTSVNVDAGNTLQIFGATDSNNLIENSAQQTVGIDLGDKSKLNLNSSGKIGDITGQGVITVAQGQKVEIVASTAANKDAAALSKLEGQQLDNYGDLNVDTVNANLVRLQSGSNLNASSVEAQNLYAVGAQASGDEFKVGYAKVEKSQIKAGNFTADDAVYVDLASSLDVSDTLKANKGLQIKGDATVTAANLYVAGGDLKVGSEATDSSSGSSAKLVANNLDLNGNNLILDPEFGQKTATAFIRSFADLDAATETTTGKAGEGTTTASTFKLNGNIVVGRNSALGLGGDESDFTAALAKLQDGNGSLKKDGIGALAYINQTQVELDGKKLVVGTEDVTTLQERLQDKSAIYLGQNSGLQIGTRAMAEAVNSDKLIFSDLTSEDIINSNGGTLIVPADMNKDKIAKIFGDQVKLSNGQTIKVQTENGAYVGVINSSDDLHGLGDFMLTANTNARQILNQMSNPTYDFYTKVRDQGANQDVSNSQTAQNSQTTANDSTDTATLAATTLDNTAAYTDSTSASVLADTVENDTENPSSESGNTVSGNNGNLTAGTGNGSGNNNTGTNNTSTDNDAYNYIIAAGSEGTGIALEQAARLANLGVSVQIANQVANTTSDAIMQRVGMNHDRQTSNGMTVVDNSRSAVWFNPVYQSFDSDSFMANDLTYGADLKLYGVAAGFDHSFNNGLRVGAMVNIGKGDADGTGVATGISNDFKYYGAGLYASIQPMRDLVLSADVSYTAVNNDLEADTGMADYGKLTTDADSSALSTGVNAQYRFNAAGLNVTPHVGMRYTRLSLDNYTVAVDGINILSSSTDSMNIFSIPLGVGISTTLTNGNWLIRPNADFNITANFGDDNVNSTTRFTGMEDIKYSTEFMDSFTYGVKAGLQVQNGNFSLGTEVGYTKSSNTQEVSVGANARLLF